MAALGGGDDTGVSNAEATDGGAGGGGVDFM